MGWYSLEANVSIFKADSLESFRLPIQTETYRFTSGDLVDSVLSSVVVATPNYTTFLGGDHPLIRIETEIENGRRGLVIKDSYGNAVCPFIAMHYVNLPRYCGQSEKLLQKQTEDIHGIKKKVVHTRI